MSMISSQCDELRDAAKRGGLVVGLPQMLNEAADLILELRDDLQRANDAMRDAEHDESMAWDRVRKTEAENAKLRELVRDMWPHVRHRASMCTSCELPCDASDECLLYEPMRRSMRELGVEVDE